MGSLQVQTYAWLRSQEPERPKVTAGILLYVNELAPRAGDVSEFRRQILKGDTDVVPFSGSEDDYNVRAWVPGTSLRLSEAFRYNRAIRVVAIDERSMAEATSAFDDTVAQIESRVVDEAECGSISRIWEPDPRNRKTCVACDFRTFCPVAPCDERPEDNEDLDDETDAA